MKLILSTLLVLVNVQLAMAFDLSAFGDAAKKLSDIKKKQDNKEEQAKKDKEQQEMMELAPAWNKLFYFTMQNNKSWKTAEVATAYWKAKPDSNFDEVENNEFEFEKEKNKIIAEIDEKVKSFKASEYQFDVSASIGKYNFKTKTIPVEDILNEDNIILTRARMSADVFTQKPMTIVTPRPVSQELKAFTVPTEYVFKLTNPKVFESINIPEDIAKQIAAQQGGRSGRVVIKMELVKVDLKDKKYFQSGTLAVAYIKINEVKLFWDGPNGEVYVGSSLK